jgi:hypothetical protein
MAPPFLCDNPSPVRLQRGTPSLQQAKNKALHTGRLQSSVLPSSVSTKTCFSFEVLNLRACATAQDVAYDGAKLARIASGRISRHAAFLWPDTSALCNLALASKQLYKVSIPHLYGPDSGSRLPLTAPEKVACHQLVASINSSVEAVPVQGSLEVGEDLTVCIKSNEAYLLVMARPYLKLNSQS